MEYLAKKILNIKLFSNSDEEGKITPWKNSVIEKYFKYEYENDW
jgi:hypothetical protein